jgi:hypothetical protein
MVVSSPSVALEQGAELAEAPLARRSDRSDGHPEVARDACVVGAFVERDDAQQSLASVVEPSDPCPQATGFVVAGGGVLGGFVSVSVASARRWALPTRHASRRAHIVSHPDTARGS